MVYRRRQGQSWVGVDELGLADADGELVPPVGDYEARAEEVHSGSDAE